ncbi:MAG: hypothetical protein M1391_08490 [Bacteroidetes bacterium]|nr:hypothetical protein [Bacteroidota bacterium]
MNRNYLTEIEKKLFKVIARENQRACLRGFYIFLSAMSVLIILLSAVEILGEFGTTARTLLFYCSLLVLVGLLIWLVLIPLLKNYPFLFKPDYFDAAKKVGNHFPEIKDELFNALQLVTEHDAHFSPELVNAAFERVYSKTKNFDFGSVVNFGSIKNFLRTAVITLTASVILLATIPGLRYASYRIINYSRNFSVPPKFVFTILPGNNEVTKGDNVSVVIKTIGEMPKEISLLMKQEDETEFAEKNLFADSSGAFKYEVGSVKNSFDYFASSEGIKSDLYKISVINRPVITNLELTIIPPAYSRLPEQTQRDNGNINALPGTRVRVSIAASREISKAAIAFGDSTTKPMQTVGAKASSEFTVMKDGNYQVFIADAQGNANINPISYSIKILSDAFPTIEMISPAQNIKLGKETKVSLVSKISDDYGFSKMNLNYRLAASKYRKSSDSFTQVPITISNTLKEDEVYFVWDLAPLVLAEGEVLSYYLEVFDNDNIGGPKSTKTRQFTITVPSLDEIFADADTKQQDATKDLSKSLQEADKLHDEFQKLSDDLKQNSKEISWDEKERAEKASEKFKELSKKVDEISQKLSEMKNDLAKNNLLSEETLKKYNELQDLLNQMSSDEMKDAFKRMQEALQSMMRDNVQMSLEDLKANEEYFKKSLERTVNLLKRIQVEQKVDELTKRAEEIAKKAEELKNKTNQSSLSDKANRDELSEHQSDITNDLKDLKDELKKLSEKMSGLTDMPKDELDKLQKEFDKQNNENLSSEAEKNLQQQQKSEAMQNQSQLSQNMQKMGKQFHGLQAGMQQMNQMKTFYDMMKIMNDLLTLSKDQENLKNKTDQLSPYSREFTENAKEQNEMIDNLSKVMKNMSALSQKTFAITPEMGKALGKAFSDMQQSITAMQNQNTPLAAQKQTNSMSDLNEAAELMKGGMDQLMSGGQGVGMMSMMQQLQMLSQQQMDLNKLTQMMNQGQLSQEMLAQMQRLAQQQDAIRKSLEELNKEARESGESKRLAANLEKILNEMKEVVTNLQSQKVNDDLVKRQERILSKLLDAQTSINERDYEEQRKSTAGKNIDRTSPPDLILNTDEGRNKLKDELTRAIKEGYKKDYEDLIRKYFESLEKERSKK